MPDIKTAVSTDMSSLLKPSAVIATNSPIPVRKEVNGYIVNAWFIALVNAAQTLVTDGMGPPEDVDRSCLKSGATRGPLSMIDRGGMQTNRVLPHHHLDEARRSLLGASSHLFANVGHMPRIETPDAFADLVREFLGTVPTGGSPRTPARRPGARRATRCSV
ncbi:3-hydroxyacyl-CoA dehydrogenase family protein [Streptomyces doebereineriae]|uniref:3-hydroxyacyl-CoA dehydrogenase family protein n=1 Tax=Streptomyces doebereineriae TaxID=3075528 RepID=A0ABU2VNM5_9ACTN|nr:3-hydroxyacyl-CoA dehydrogenase family protein [Streptomyces sp. DSM 41640]MDT0487200.1 3-hydroxyacyl-CoA dehydrogenase family protein [Streptomyces sp. DSM 41640]